MSTPRERLTNEHGAIVRPMTSFGLEGALRITIGTPEENARPVEALRTVLGQGTARS